MQQKTNNLAFSSYNFKNSFFVSFLIHCLIFIAMCFHVTKDKVRIEIPVDFFSVEQIHSSSSNVDEKIAEPLQIAPPVEKIEQNLEKTVAPKPEVKTEISVPAKNIEKLKINDEKAKKEEKIPQPSEQISKISTDDDDLPILSEKVVNASSSNSTQISPKSAVQSATANSAGIGTGTEAGETGKTNVVKNVKFNQNFQFFYYVKILKEKVNNNWLAPYVTSSSNVNTVVNFQILRNGEIKNIKINKTSGFKEFDEAAKNAILKSSPLPGLPDDYKEEPLDVVFEFEFV